MFLHLRIATNVWMHSPLCAAPCQAVITCSLAARCLHTGCMSPIQCQGINMACRPQHTRQHLWSGQQQHLTRTLRSHRASLGQVGVDATQWNKRNIISEYTYSTYKTSELEQTSDVAQKDEVDFEALVKLEIELHRQEGFRVPSEITPVQWEELLTIRTFSGRKKYLIFLFKNEMKRNNERKSKELKRKKRQEEERQRRENPPEEDGHIEYGLWKNSIFPKILDTSMNHFYHTRVVQSILYGQPLVVDLDFEEHMSSKERQNCAFQIQMMIAANRIHEDPYNLEIHNALPTLDVMARLERYIPILHKPEYPVTVNPKSYLEKYPKEQLVYLTPHCKETLRRYDHDAVYIIGGIVDKSSGEPLTLAKAKREGIRMQKLPLDKYLAWGIGNKSLTLNQMMNIMLDFKVTGDWAHALRHVPQRKLQLPLQTQQAKEQALLHRIRNRERNLRPSRTSPNRKTFTGH